MNRATIPILLALSLVLLLGLATQAAAESKALIIGVGKYALPEANLPGIDKDVARMRSVAKSLGFNEGQTRVLTDGQATLSAIKQGLGWAASGVSGPDRVLVYFSGHGSRVSEIDGKAKSGGYDVLLPYDTQVEGKSLKNVLVDSDFGALLAKIPAKQIFVLIDACHSGTATTAKGLLLTESNKVKFFWYPGVDEVVQSKGGADAFLDGARGAFSATKAPGGAEWSWVALSAAQDNEKAQASPDGSYFTTGIANGTEQAGRQSKEITLRQLQDIAQKYISSQLKGEQVHHPHLTGDKQLAAVNLFASATSGQPGGRSGQAGRENAVSPPPARQPETGRGDPWREVESLVSGADYPVEVSLNKSNFGMGESMVITCNVKQDGYLNVVNVSKETGEITIIFPNKFTTQNFVKKGRVLIPEQGAGFALNATESGKALVAAFVTKNNKNLLKDFDPGMKAAFPSMQTESLRGAFGAVEAPASGHASGQSGQAGNSGRPGGRQSSGQSSQRLGDLGAGAATATIR